MIKKWWCFRDIKRIYISGIEILISITWFAFKEISHAPRIYMQFIFTCNKQILVHSSAWNCNTAITTVITWFESVWTQFALLIIVISPIMKASQAIRHLFWSFSAHIHCRVSALSNWAIIIDAPRLPFLGLFWSTLNILIIAVVIVKETFSTHLAAIFIACCTIVSEVFLAISALNFPRFRRVYLFEILICFTIKIVTLLESYSTKTFFFTSLEHRQTISDIYSIFRPIPHLLSSMNAFL